MRLHGQGARSLGKKRPARRRHPVRRVRVHAHRGLGRQQRHPHPWHPRLRHATPLRTGDWPRASPAVYELNEDGLFDAEYADIFGVPFDFTAKPVVAPPSPPRETVQVKAVRPDRDHLEIRFPRVEGYRVELPTERLTATFTADSELELTPDLVGPTNTRNQGIIGEAADLTVDHLEDVRPSTLLFHLTKRLLYKDGAIRARSRSCTSSDS